MGCPKLGYTDSVLVLLGEAALEEEPCLEKKGKEKKEYEVVHSSLRELSKVFPYRPAPERHFPSG